MKNSTHVAELQEMLGSPSSGTVEGLRLLKAFLKLSRRQRFDIVEFIERLEIDPGSSWKR